MKRLPWRLGLQDCNPVASCIRFRFSGFVLSSALSRNVAGTVIALEQERYGFQRKTPSCSTFWKFVISGTGFTRSPVHPASGSDGEGCPLPPSFQRVHARRLRGHSTPPGIPPPPPGTTSPVTSPRSSLNKKKGPGRVGQVLRVRMVAPPRIELGTRGFSVLCSTI